MEAGKFSRLFAHSFSEDPETSRNALSEFYTAISQGTLSTPNLLQLETHPRRNDPNPSIRANAQMLVGMALAHKAPDLASRYFQRAAVKSELCRDMLQKLIQQDNPCTQVGAAMRLGYGNLLLENNQDGPEVRALFDTVYVYASLLRYSQPEIATEYLRLPQIYPPLADDTRAGRYPATATSSSSSASAATTVSSTRAQVEAEPPSVGPLLDDWFAVNPTSSAELVDKIYNNKLTPEQQRTASNYAADIANNPGSTPAQKSQALALQGMICANTRPIPAVNAAQSFLGEALLLNKENQWALTSMAIMHVKRQIREANHNDAARLLKTISASEHPAAPLATFWLGVIYNDPRRPQNHPTALALYLQAYSSGKNDPEVEMGIGKLLTVDNMLVALPKYRVPVLKLPKMWDIISPVEKRFMVTAILANPVITAILPEADTSLQFLEPRELTAVKKHLQNNNALKAAYDLKKESLLANSDLWPETMEKAIHGTDLMKTYSMLELSIRYGDSDFTQKILRHMPREQLSTLTQARGDKPVDDQHFFEKLADNYPNGVRRNTFRQWVDAAKQNPLIDILAYLEAKSSATGGEKLRYNDRVADFTQILNQLRTLMTSGGKNAAAEKLIEFNPGAPNFDDFKEIFIEMIEKQRATHPIAGRTFFGVQTSQEQYLKFCEQLKTLSGEALYYNVKQFDAHLDKCPASVTVNALRGATMDVQTGQEKRARTFSQHDDL